MILSTLRRTFHKYPLLANIAIFTSLYGSADTVSQIIEKKGIAKFDFQSLRIMTTIGLIYNGPVYFYYYRLLDRMLPGKNPRTIFSKLIIDQCLFTIPALAGFFMLSGYLEGKPWEENIEELKMKWLPTYATSCTFWPLAQCVNFIFVPPVYRVVYVSSLMFVWAVFLSYIRNRPQLPVILQRIENLTSSKENQIEDAQET